MVHAPFKKIIKFDLLCMGIGAIIGMGVGAYFVASWIIQLATKFLFFD